MAAERLARWTVNAIVAAAAIGIAGVWLAWCHDPAVRADERARQKDGQADIRIARLAHEGIVQENEFRRAIAVADARADRSAARADSLGQALLARPGTVYLRADVEALVASHRVAIADKDSTIAKRNRAIILLAGHVTSYRDTIVPDLQRARDRWRAQVPPASQAWTDLAGAAIAGYGAAKENGTVVGIGVATVVLPRAAHAIGRIFHRAPRLP